MAPHTATARVKMLDNSIHTYDVKVKNFGTVLFHSVMEDLNLLEADYFGIQFPDKEGKMTFLDPLKKIKSQIKNISNTILQFVVKFFPPDPGQLQEEYTRYLFALQIKQDLASGLLPCTETALVAMAACIVQSDFGDWSSMECADRTYLREIRFLPPCASPDNTELLSKISQQHRQKMGTSPADADFQLLDIARRLEHYGLRLQQAKDQENTVIDLGVANMGVVVFRGSSKINTFNWARIRKLSFKKKRFLIKLRTESNVGNNVGDILVFVMSSRDTCKNFWRQCIEYHAFFRLEVHPERKPQPLVLKRGSTFRYSGKTQKQLHELVRNSNFRRTTFVRASTRRNLSGATGAKARRNSFSNATTTFQPTTFVENGGHEEPVFNEFVSDVPSPISLNYSPHYQHATPEAPSVSPIDDHKQTGKVETYESPTDHPTPNTSSYMAAQAWQVESENLHSSVAPPTPPIQEVKDEAKGNGGVLHANQIAVTDIGMIKPDLLNGVSSIIAITDSTFSTRVLPLAPHSNDNRDEAQCPSISLNATCKTILSIESVSSSSKSSSISRSSTGRSTGSSVRYRNQEPLPPPPPPPQENFMAVSTAPPIPPKSLRVNTPQQRARLSDMSQIKHMDSSTDDLCNDSSSENVNMAHRTLKDISQNAPLLSASEISIPGIGGGIRRTPSQYASIEKKMIKAGFYSAPSKPPIPPTLRENSHISQDFTDNDIDRALNELDIATRSLQTCLDTDENTSICLNDSVNGMYGVLVRSDSEISDVANPANSLSFDQSMMTPIPMQFNDNYIAPDYCHNNALSSFATEMEASFDRIRQSMSTEDLDSCRRKPVEIPLTSSMDVLSMGDVESVYNRTDNELETLGINPNNNNSCHETPSHRTICDDHYTIEL